VLYQRERDLEFNQQFSDDVNDLVLMFPSVELALIQQLYLDNDSNKSLAVEQLLALSL